MVSTLSSLQAFLKKINKKPSKGLSQNFLVDKNVIDKIISAANIKKDPILEIGPGPGALTENIKANVIAIEKDKDFAQKLKRFPHVQVFQADFLKFSLREVLKKNTKVIANLPYHITSPIIAKLFKHHDLISEMILMVQLDMAKRICASKDCKSYGSFTVFINFYTDAKFLFKVSKESFYPKPKVDSAIIKLKMKDIPTDICLEDFHNFVKSAFSKRRKKLISSLKGLNIDLVKCFTKLNIDVNARPENLSVDDFYNLFKKVYC